MASALPYGTHEKKLRFAMKIGGDYPEGHRVFSHRSTWTAAAEDLGLDAERVLERVESLAARASDADGPSLLQRSSL